MGSGIDSLSEPTILKRRHGNTARERRCSAIWLFGYLAIWPSGTDALHRELADHQVPPGNGLGHREVVGPWVRGAGGGENGGEHGAEGPGGRRAQGHIDGGV